jgi:hypothetical protein
MKLSIESEAARSGEDADKNRDKLIKQAEKTLESSRSTSDLTGGSRNDQKSGCATHNQPNN